MKYAFEIFEMDEEDFKATYPGKSTEAFADDTTGWFGIRFGYVGIGTSRKPPQALHSDERLYSSRRRI